MDLVNAGFVKLAQSFGAEGVRIESIKDVKLALERALRADKPTLIEVPLS